MSFNKSFLEDEVRLGFYIPASIKQAWAAELEILKAIDKVCSDCNIEYFADWGTFLGAVRHGGFVPWDDDIDLVMKRKDYDLFLAKAPSLLPEGYSVHTFRNEEGFREFHAVVQNAEHPHFDKEHFDRFHGFPYPAGIDIFVLDYVHTSEADENKRVEDILFLISLADGILENEFEPAVRSANLMKAEMMTGMSFTGIQNIKELWIKLYEAAERKCAAVSGDESDTLIQMVPWGLKRLRNKRYKASDYGRTVFLPFEDTHIPVPLFYDELLSRRYGDYMTLLKNAGAHDYPYFEKQKKDFEARLNFKLPEFTFDSSVLRAKTNNSDDNWRNVVRECLSEIEGFHATALSDDANKADALCNAQQLAIDLGTLIEGIKGEGHICVSYLEKYCESIFNVFSLLEISDSEALAPALTSLEISFTDTVRSIENDLLAHKEIVFLPDKAEHWANFKPFYDKFAADDSCDVFVVPIPYYFKEYDGTLSDERYDLASYPDELKLCSYEDFSLEFHRPDMIFIQNPFDAFNASTSIHPAFYSETIKDFTDELVYVPAFETYDFDESDDPRSYKNMDAYAVMPGVLYADKVILPTAKCRDNYIKKLTAWAGEETKEYWAGKISVASAISLQINSNITNSFETENAPAEKSERISLLYCLETGPECQNARTFIDKLNRNIDILSANEKLSVTLSYGNSLPDSLNKFFPELLPEFNRSIERARKCDSFRVINSENIVPDKSFTDEFDAFYGDRGTFACAFSYYGKPVMIQDFSV